MESNLNSMRWSAIAQRKRRKHTPVFNINNILPCTRYHIPAAHQCRIFALHPSLNLSKKKSVAIVLIVKPNSSNRCFSSHSLSMTNNNNGSLLNNNRSTWLKLLRNKKFKIPTKYESCHFKKHSPLQIMFWLTISISMERRNLRRSRSRNKDNFKMVKTIIKLFLVPKDNLELLRNANAKVKLSWYNNKKSTCKALNQPLEMTWLPLIH